MRLAGVRPELLQTFRLSHALAEAGVPLALVPAQAEAFQWISQYFEGIDWRVTRWARPIKDVSVDHRTPLTRVGSVKRPLLFAHGIHDRCRSKWDERSYVMTFAGLMTRERRSTLRPLIDRLGTDFRLLPTDSGRKWPLKAWDDDYYTALGRSALTACPNGDFIWTYRFFEAAMCGSIPVIQDYCEHYEGFHFYHMMDDPTRMIWRMDWAEHNRALAQARLTAPHDQLLAAVGWRAKSRGRF